MTEIIMLDYAGVITRDYQESNYPSELARKFGVNADDFIRINKELKVMAQLCLGEIDENVANELVISNHPGARRLEGPRFVSDSYGPDPETLERLAIIKSQKLASLALVSNIFPASINYLRDHGVEKYFDYRFYSCEMGDKKPNPSFFLKVLNVCGVNVDSAIFLDDTQANVTAAQNLGIKSYHILDRSQVHTILDEFIDE